MKKWPAYLILFLASLSAFAQQPGQATVTATKSTYAGGTVTATFVPIGVGSPTSTVVTGAINLNGYFSVLTWNNTFNAYTPSVTLFQICGAPPNSSICFTAAVNVSGNVDISSAFNGAPNPGNGGNNGGGIPSLTPGVVPKSTGTSLANSGLDDGVTTPNTVTNSDSGGYAGKSYNSTDTVHNGYSEYGPGSGGDSTCPAPASGLDILCPQASVLNLSQNGAAYAPIVTSATTKVTGTATLASGTALVSNAAACAVGASCIYKFTNCGVNASTGIGQPSLGTVSAGVSFVINSLSATNTTLTTDASTICWQIN